MVIPPEYHNREQSYLKHRILREYLLLWGMKLGSLEPQRLWYVDCFSGPWQSTSERLEDTSIHIGLSVLAEAIETWREKGLNISAKAIFVEKDPASFASLESYLETQTSGIDTIALHGEFGDHADDIALQLGKDPAFIFVDPTGFKGAGVQHIAKLTKEQRRDVMINVMFNHLRRFQDDSRAFLRDLFREFFGGELPPDLSEDELMQTYREGLKSNTTLQYAADLAMPHPTKERTWFRLVVAGKHTKVLEVFRAVEEQVMAKEAAQVRTGARARDTENRTRQMALLDTSPDCDTWYAKENTRGRDAAIQALLEQITPTARVRYGEIWPRLLEEHHITLRQLDALVLDCARSGAIRLEPQRPRRTRVANDDEISRGSGPT